jgi:enoyl-[acyl-carrier protein] reductase III
MAVINQTFKDLHYWAVILGGSSGMGLATAQKLASEGMNLCIIHRDGRVRMKQIEVEFDALRALGIKVITFNKDASLPDTVDEVIAGLKGQLSEHGKVRMLLHSVARGNLKPMYAKSGEAVLEIQDFQLTIEAMALNWYRWASDLVGAGLFATDARLLALTSEGNAKAWRGYGAVSAAKATLEALCRNMALEFAPIGLRCNVIQAGVTDTPSLRMIPRSEEMLEMATKRNPFQRLTTPQDVANVIHLLCTREAAWINGAVIPVDGGEKIV